MGIYLVAEGAATMGEQSNQLHIGNGWISDMQLLRRFSFY